MSDVYEVPLNNILPNPYQPRETEDAEHVQKLAYSIADEGLLQIPSGRLVSSAESKPFADLIYQGSDWCWSNGYQVELAFGHSRLAAYKLLDWVQRCLLGGTPIEGDWTEDSPMGRLVALVDQLDERGGAPAGKWSTMPVAVRDLDNEAMFEQALRENIDRRDLTAIEKAKAMVRYRDEFSKNSGEIGALFGYSDSAVRNIFRLLKLPGDLQAQLINAPETVLREVLSLLDLPEDTRRAAEAAWPDETKPSAIIREAVNGATAERLHALIGKLIERYAEKFAPTWKGTDVFDGPQIVGVCKGCAFHLKRDNTEYCVNKACYWAKVKAARLVYLRQASLLSGISVLEDTEKNYWDTSNFHTSDGDLLETARAAGCPNLRLIYYEGYSGDQGSLKDQGFPKAFIVCGKRKGFCACRTAHETGVSIRKLDAAMEAIAEESGEPTNQPADSRMEAAPEKSAPLSAEDLSEIARQARAAKRQANAEFEAMQADMAKRLAEALESGNAYVWRMLADKIAGWQSKTDLAPAFDYRLTVAETIASGLYYPGGAPNLAVALEKFNSTLKAAGLEALESHLDQPAPKPAPQLIPAAPAVEPAGKTLAEVFHDGDPENQVPGKGPDETLAEYFFRTGQDSKICYTCQVEMTYDPYARAARCPKCDAVEYFELFDNSSTEEAGV